MRYILSIDQGTSSTKTIVFDAQGKAVARASEPLKTHYLKDGYVEQEPEDIWQNVLASVKKCIDDFKANGGDPAHITACGISNQRETFVVWDKDGVPLYNAVVWQCKRSVAICEQLAANGMQETIKTKTGLIIDPYFSGTKLIWLNRHVPAVRDAINKGNAYFGTVDTWLLFKLTNGKSYYTDFTNASRTMFFNLSTLAWDKALLQTFGLSNINLPQAKPSSFPFGVSNFNGLFNTTVPITAMIGDSHAAAFGEGCFSPGTAKATLGTGCSILMNIGSKPAWSAKGMITTICWSTQNRVDYALEGVIVTCGATIEWLKNELALFTDSAATAAMANAVADSNGVYLVPAFSGLGAPHWDMKRKASISGLTFGSNKNHIVRAALESIPYQVKDVIAAMESGTRVQLQQLMTDGGMTANTFVLQFLADLLGKQVINIGMPDVSALGAAYLSGLQAGVYKDLDQLTGFKKQQTTITPSSEREKVLDGYEGWKLTVSRES
jgi:glycerol kinase